jgi:hypothetical protein
MASIIKADTLQSTTANVSILNSSGTEYARFDSSGVFQLANPTTFPAGTVSLPSITATGDTNTGLYFPAADTIAASTAGSERMRIDSSGNVGIGTANIPSNKDTVTPKFIVNGAGVAGSMQVVRNTTVGGGGGILELTATRGTDVNSYTILQSGDGVGSVIFGGADGTQFTPAAQITASVDGTPGANDMPGRLIFSTTADGASSTTERMRIDSAGLVTIASGQIKFPATQSASTDANTLDDYEEGTWTPVIKFAGNNVGMTFSNQTGTYVKIGRQVIVWYIILLTAKGSSIGNATITGVPFAAGSYGHGVLDLNSGMTAVPATGGYGIIAGSEIYLRYNNTTGYADFNNTMFTNTSLIIGVVTYYV